MAAGGGGAAPRLALELKEIFDADDIEALRRIDIPPGTDISILNHFIPGHHSNYLLEVLIERDIINRHNVMRYLKDLREVRWGNTHFFEFEPHPTVELKTAILMLLDVVDPNILRSPDGISIVYNAIPCYGYDKIFDDILIELSRRHGIFQGVVFVALREGFIDTLNHFKEEYDDDAIISILNDIGRDEIMSLIGHYRELCNIWTDEIRQGWDVTIQGRGDCLYRLDQENQWLLSLVPDWFH